MWTSSLRKASTIAALGVGILAAVGIAPAIAVNIKTKTFKGTFDSEIIPNFIAQNKGESVKDDEKSAVTRNKFRGLLRPECKKAGDFVDMDDSVAYPCYERRPSLYDSASKLAGLPLGSLPSFTGTGNNTKVLSENTLNKGGEIGVATVSSQAVPEPMTIAASAVAAGMGLWMKRKQKSS